MSQILEFPSRRDGLDTGSVAELAQDGRELDLPTSEPLHWSPEHVEIDVPDDAARLLIGLGDYGS
jgi:hypothetical protein